MGQMSEIFFMLVMPFFFARLGVKKMLLIGMASWATRYLLFAYGNSGTLVWLFYTAILLHGICYDFFFVAGQIYVDQRAPVKIRGAAQGFLAFATFGVGWFLGSWSAGKVVQAYSVVQGGEVAGHHWDKIWVIPAIGAAVVLVLFQFFFRPTLTAKEMSSQKA